MIKSLCVAITKTVLLKKRYIVNKIVQKKIKLSIDKEIIKADKSPIVCVANYLLGDDSALKRMRIKYLIKYGYTRKVVISDSLKRVADKVICKLMGYKVGATIKRLNAVYPDLYQIVSYEGSTFIIALLINGDPLHKCSERLTITQLIDGEWVVHA